MEVDGGSVPRLVSSSMCCLASTAGMGSSKSREIYTPGPINANDAGLTNANAATTTTLEFRDQSQEAARKAWDTFYSVKARSNAPARHQPTSLVLLTAEAVTLAERTAFSAG